jgi:hypothetical protein
MEVHSGKAHLNVQFLLSVNCKLEYIMVNRNVYILKTNILQLVLYVYGEVLMQFGIMPTNQVIKLLEVLQ